METAAGPEAEWDGGGTEGRDDREIERGTDRQRTMARARGDGPIK